ncbi:MAG: AMP-binding protein [Rhodospirillaceae bacterium]|jgi:carnitine-CoA ligase|nr:AMP-binding protein [Rhodospirillaceae bacterium]
MSLKQSIEQSQKFLVEGRDIPWLLNTWAERTPDKAFLVWEPFDGEMQTWTYAELAHDVEALAAGLSARGIKFGDFVLIHLDNSPEFVISWFACARLGAVAVATNTRSVARDMSYFANHVGAVAAITQPAYAKMVHGSAPKLKFIAVTDNDSGVPAEVPEIVPHTSFAELLIIEGGAPQRPVDPMANLGIQFTSGTTSRPKAVLWTHANGIWGALRNAAHMHLGTEDITLIVLPLFHTNAQAYSMLGTLWVGGTMVVQPKFSASRFWDVARKHKCTWASMVLFCVKVLLSRDPPPDHHFRFWGCSGHHPPAEAAYGIKTMGWWGMTETITHGIVGDIYQPGPPLCIGRVAQGYDVEIRHRDGTLIKPGEQGLLFIRGVRGVSLFKEYFRNPEANASAFDDDGWFETGDVISMDKMGNLFFSDRDKDMLRVGSENVAASEIEAVILATGWVHDCAVVGQKHHLLDEVPIAFVVAKSDAPENLSQRIIEVCGEKLADFKVVRDVIALDDMPRGTLDKIDKKELRSQLVAIEA